MENIDRLFVASKQAYIKGDRPDVPCILCAVVEKNPKVDLLDIFRSKNFIVSANLFPYNPGHIMIFPNRHIESIEFLSEEEVMELHKLEVKSLEVLKKTYQAHGYNVGYNLGIPSGASIPHLHKHIVPRYPREVGFIDVIAGARIIVEDPLDTVKKLKAAFNEA